MNNYVLIAEPDRDLASSHAFMLAYDGLTAVVAADGDAALAVLAERGAPELLLTDLSLPDLDGFELIEALRRRSGGDKTPVVVLSASRDLRGRAAEMRAELGISAILATAVSTDSLLRVVKRLIETPGASPPEASAGDDAAEASQVFAAVGRDSGIRLRALGPRRAPSPFRRFRAERPGT